MQILHITLRDTDNLVWLVQVTFGRVEFEVDFAQSGNFQAREFQDPSMQSCDAGWFVRARIIFQQLNCLLI